MTRSATPATATAEAWRPLLGGSDAERALTAVREIAGDLELPGAGRPRCPLVDGEAGKALFFGYLEEACPGEGFGERGLAHLEAAVEHLGGETSDLLYGFTGVAWTLEHLRGRLFAASEDDEDVNEEIDEALEARLAPAPWRGPWELLGGPVGLAVYALRRLPRPRAAACLELVVERLAELAVEEPSGVTWPDPTVVERPAGETARSGDVRLGVAHGVPGVIAVLARIHAAGVARGKAGPLLEGALSWLLAKRPDGQDSLFPSPLDSRGRYGYSAWCHGDPGTAAALLVAARASGDLGLEEKALAFARFAARAPEEVQGVADCGLCHGAAGLAHLLARLFQATGESRTAEAAQAWYRFILERHEPGRGVGGFTSWGRTEGGTEEDRKLGWRVDPTLLTGSLGTGLALLAAATPVEPRWDELLLVSPIHGPDPGDSA